MAPSFLLTFIFTIIFTTSINDVEYLFDKSDVVFYALTPTLSLPVFLKIGDWLNGKWLAKQEQKRQEYNKAIDQEIGNIRLEIQSLKKEIKDKVVINHFIDMLDYCGADTSTITNDSRISNISEVGSKIRKNKEHIEVLQNQKK